jgi:hypothetical protein
MFCATVATMYLFLRSVSSIQMEVFHPDRMYLTQHRSISVAATFFFVFAIRDPSSVWVEYLVMLNVTLFFPPRLILLGGGLLRALNTTSNEQMDPMGADDCPTLISMQLPLTLVIMPCHRELLAVVLASVNSVAQSTYTHDRIHIFLSFDGPQNMDIFAQLVETVGARENASRQFPCAEISIGNAKLTVCLFEHGGKARCQRQTVDYIKRYHDEYFQSASDTYVLLLDSDTIICQSALRLLATRLVSTDVHLVGQGSHKGSSILHLRNSTDSSPYHASRVFREHRLPFWLPYRKLNISCTASCSKLACQCLAMSSAFPALQSTFVWKLCLRSLTLTSTRLLAKLLVCMTTGSTVLARTAISLCILQERLDIGPLTYTLVRYLRLNQHCY